MAIKDDDIRLIRTKLHRPRPLDELVSRPRLFELLDRQLKCPLTLVVAPAGYGKTTLVSSWLETACGKSSWLSLDEYDNDLGTFLLYLTSAIRQTFPGSCSETIALLDGVTLPPVRTIATSLINDLATIPDRHVLVLDDYHTIREPAIHELFDVLLHYPPESLRLVLISRHDPLMPLARLRVQGQLTEVRTQHLRFTRTEIAALVKLCFSADAEDAAIEDETVMRLEEGTEGWVTGLRLTILSRQHQVDGGGLAGMPLESERYVTDYLLSEVFAQQRPDIQTFLVKTSVFDRLSASLCEAVLGSDLPESDVQGFLSSAHAANLFVVSLDGQAQWFRYHHLLRGFLQDQARSRLTPAEIAALHRRAARWFSGEDLVEEALRHFLAAGDYEGATRLLVDQRHILMSRGYWSGIRRYLKMLPVQIVGREPDLAIQEAWIKRIEWQSASMRLDLERAETVLEASVLEERSKRSLTGEIHALRATLLLQAGAAREAVNLLEDAIKAIDPHHSYVRGYATMLLAHAYQVNGEFDTAVALLSEALRDSQADTQLQLRLWSALGLIHYLQANLDGSWLAGTRYNEISHGRAEEDGMKWGEYRLACVSYFRNDLAAAAASFRACSDRPRAVHTMTTTNTAIGLAMTYQAQGRTEQARELAERNVTVLRELGHVALLPLAEAFRAELAARQGRLAEAMQWIPHAATVSIEQEYIGFYAPQLALPKILLIENSPESRQKACVVLAELRELMERRHNKRFLIEVLTLLALAHRANGNLSRARDDLSRAVRLGAPGRFVRPFIDIGPGLLPLLTELAPSGDAADYVNQIISACAGPASPDDRSLAAPALQPSTRQTHSDLIESLTNREMDVLLLLAERLTNKEIARELGISNETVKQHSINLYRKLHVNSRRQATSAARAMGIL